MEIITNNFIKEIELYINDFCLLQNYEKEISHYVYQEKINDSNFNKLKNQETYYDKLYEGYQRSESFLASEKRIKLLCDEFISQMNHYSKQYQEKNEERGNKMNQLLIEMERNEKEIKKNNFDPSYVKSSYTDYMIKTKLFIENQKRKEEEEMKQKIIEEKRRKIMEENEKLKHQQEEFKKEEEEKKRKIMEENEKKKKEKEQKKLEKEKEKLKKKEMKGKKQHEKERNKKDIKVS